MPDKLERATDTLQKIVDWAEAYPEEMFPPVSSEDIRRAKELLAAAGSVLARCTVNGGDELLTG